MADINGAGGANLGGLSASGSGHTEWWKVLLTGPPDGEIEPATFVTVEVTAETWDGSAVNVQLQVSTSSLFGSTVYDSTSAATGDGVTPTPHGVSGLVDGTTYYTRARVRTGTWDGPWTTTRSFRVLLAAGDAVEYIYENVGIPVDLVSDIAEYIYENVGIPLAMDSDIAEYIYENVGTAVLLSSDAVEYAYEGDVDTSTPTPVIWFLKPNYGRAGDGIQIVGFGFGDLQATYSGTVQLEYPAPDGWVTVPVTSWQTFPADAGAYTSARELNEITGYIDMQHTVIEITIPGDAVPPGYPLRVRTDGP